MQSSRRIRSLTDIARAHGIGVAIGSVTPVCDTPETAQTTHRDLDQIKALNVWLRAFAKRSGFVYLDYHAALIGPDGALHPALTEDGLHPNREGYARMEKVLKTSGVLEN